MTSPRHPGASSRAWQVPDDRGVLRVAVLGAGKMARFHLAALAAMPGVRLVALCNRGGPNGARLAGEFGVEAVFDNAAQMLEQVAPDAAIVAVGHGATVEMSELVLSRGVPSLIEKPAGYSSSQTAALAELAGRTGCVNMVGLNRRFYSTIQQALFAVLRNGPIAGVAIEAHEAIVDLRTSGQFESWLYDEWLVANSIHAIDLFRMIGGEPLEVHALSTARFEARGDSFSASIRFADGALGTFIAHWSSVRGMALRIYGDGVTVEFAGLERGVLKYSNGRTITLQPDWADIRFKTGIYWQDACFLQAVCDGEAPPVPASDLADNVATMRLVEAIGGRGVPRADHDAAPAGVRS